MQLDASVVDLLLSRLLHELIGLVTATVNGIELIEEFGDKSNASIAAEAHDLIGTSARQSADRLSYFAWPSEGRVTATSTVWQRYAGWPRLILHPARSFSISQATPEMAKNPAQASPKRSSRPFF